LPDGGRDAGPGADAPDADAPGADGGVALDNFLEQAAKAACAWEFRCCSLPEIDTIGQSSYLTESECVSQSLLQLRVLLAAERSALLDGRLTVDAGKLGACVQQLTTRACNSALHPEFVPIGVGALLVACQDPFVGQTPVGARCTNLRECMSGSVCSHFVDGAAGYHVVDAAHISAPFPLAMPVSADGICVADQKEGQRCFASQQCQVGLYCRRTDFVCAVPAREGDPCISEERDTEAPDGPPIVCGTGAVPLLCVADVCRRLPREGEPCLSTSDALDPGGGLRCDPTPALDLACVGEELGGDGVCKKAAGRGATCGGSGIPPCSVSLQCEVVDGGDLGTCQDFPGTGESCLGFGCRAPAVCYTGTMTCVVPPPSARYGAKCQSDLDCASLFCGGRFGSDDAKCAHTMDGVVCIGAGVTPATSNTPPPMPL
jgi:hypothetical protein